MSLQPDLARGGDTTKMFIMSLSTHFNIWSRGANGLNASPAPPSPSTALSRPTMTLWWQLQLYPALWPGLSYSSPPQHLGHWAARRYWPWGMEMNEGSWEEKWRKELLTIRWLVVETCYAETDCWRANWASVVVGICWGHNETKLTERWMGKWRVVLPLTANLRSIYAICWKLECPCCNGSLVSLHHNVLTRCDLVSTQRWQMDSSIWEDCDLWWTGLA